MSNDLERRLQDAAASLAEPDPGAEERLRRAVLPVGHARRGSRLSRKTLALALAVAIPSILVGTAIGAVVLPAGSGSTRSTYPGPTFTPAAGWTTLETGPVPANPDQAPVAWATNVPLAAGANPFGIPYPQIEALPPDGIVVLAVLPAPEVDPAPEGAPYVDRELPLQLSDAEVRPLWEGQPSPSVPAYVLWSRVNDQWLDVRVYFGTQDPSRALLDEAQRELDRLVIPDRS